MRVFHQDAGLTWQNATANLPNVTVVDLVYQAATKFLICSMQRLIAWHTVRDIFAEVARG